MSCDSVISWSNTARSLVWSPMPATPGPIRRAGILDDDGRTYDEIARTAQQEEGRDRMLTVEPWPLARLIPYARNPRRNDEAVDRMCTAIREFGFRIPVVARSDGTVIDGHLRLKAAQRLGLADVPVALADDLSEAQIKAFRLLANRSAAWAE